MAQRRSSENETINMISNMVRLSLWLVPLLAFVILFVGYIITKALLSFPLRR